jgi:hypothetical protein
LITSASLQDYTRKDLAEMAKQKGIDGWHSMRKDQLVRALMRKAGGKAKTNSVAVATRSRAKTNGKSARHRNSTTVVARGTGSQNGRRSTTAAKQSTKVKRSVAKPVNGSKRREVLRKIEDATSRREKLRDLSTASTRKQTNGRNAKSSGDASNTVRDRLILMVRDAYWLHVCWELTGSAIERAQAAMAEQWHTATPMLRLLEVEKGSTTSSAERVVREIEIHGGVNNWYIDVLDPPKSYRVDIGYKAASGRFFTLCRSNSVSTPLPGSLDAVDENWLHVAKDYEQIFALSGGYSDEQTSGELQELFEERLRRPMGSPLATRYGIGAERAFQRSSDFALQVDAEMIIYGRTKPDAYVTLSGKPIKLRPDGSFTVRQSMPDRRQVLPVVAGSSDGVEQRTVVLAVERNTKVMEPYVREGNE